MPTLSIPAPAKLNLGLQVLDRRPDGYHEIVTILQTLELADTVHISNASQIEGEPSLPGLARAQDLTFKAAERLHARLRAHTGAYLRVNKHVPSGAGLGGGSSDAAATLLGLDAFWQTGADGSLLAEIARSLGADVPFFLQGGTMLATGRGDLLEPLAAPPRRWVLLVRPDAEIAAADAYATLHPTEWSDGADTLVLGGAIQQGELPVELIRNDLTPSAMRLVPEVGKILERLTAEGAAPAFLVGSGPTCCGLFGSEQDATDAHVRFRAPNVWTALTRFRRKSRPQATNGSR